MAWSCCQTLLSPKTRQSSKAAGAGHSAGGPSCIADLLHAYLCMLLSCRRREDVHITAADLLNIRGMPGSITEAGVRGNLHVALAYMESWLRCAGRLTKLEQGATSQQAVGPSSREVMKTTRQQATRSRPELICQMVPRLGCPGADQVRLWWLPLCYGAAAQGCWLRAHPQPDGGRCHCRDQPQSAVAVGAPRGTHL